MSSFWRKLPRPITALAPMEEITDTVFRQMVAWCGRPDVLFTEFTSVEGLCSPGREAVIHRLEYSAEEKPLVAQLWGICPENFYKAAALVKELGFDGVDINMGCSVPKIIKKGGCAALIENPDLAREIFLAVKEGSGLPVSIKTRIGFSEVKTEDWIGFLLKLNPEVITIHGRIAKHLLKYRADWTQVEKAVQLRDQTGSSTLILGNGDVRSLTEIQKKTEKHRVDGVMVGRGILHNLFLFQKDQQVQFKELGMEEKLDLLLKHVELFEKTWKERKYFGELKKLFKYYASGFQGASKLRLDLVQSQSLDEVRELIADNQNISSV